MSTAGTPTAFLWISVCGLLCAFIWANEARGQDTTRSAIQDTTSEAATPAGPSAVDTTGAPTVVDSAGADGASAEVDTSTSGGVAGGKPAGADSAAVATDSTAIATDSTVIQAPADTAAAPGPVIPSSPVLDTLSNEVFQRTLQAYLAVRDIQPAFRARYGSTGARAADDTTYRAFQRTAEQAIRSTGLAVKTYQALLAAAQTDTLLRGVLRRGLAGRGDSAFVPLDSLRPDSSWILEESGAPADSMPADEAPPDTAAADTGAATPAPADTSLVP